MTLSQYAASKLLPVDFLEECGLSDDAIGDRPAVRIPYFGANGDELVVRFRIALVGDRFRWKYGSKLCLYGLNRLADARKAKIIIMVEGESDCHTLWHAELPATGLPGAGNWNEGRDAKYFDGIDTIYIVIEPDNGGDSVRKWLRQSAIRARANLLQLPAKDPSAMYIADPAGFKNSWQSALLGAVPWASIEANERAAERADSWKSCKDLARAENLLAEFDHALAAIGLVGERRVASSFTWPSHPDF